MLTIVLRVRSVTALALSLCSLIACHRSPRAGTEQTSVPQPSAAAKDPGADEAREIPLVLVKANGQLGPGRGTLVLDVQAPKGGELTEGAPLRVSAQGKDLTFPENIETNLKLSELPLHIPLDVADGASGPALLDVTYYYCTKGEKGSCRPERTRLEVELDLTGGAPGGEAHLVLRPKA